MELKQMKISSGGPVSPVSALTEKEKLQKFSGSKTIKINNHARINRVFLRFAVIYGHLWKSLYRHDEFLDLAKKEWTMALQAFSDDAIFQAVVLSRQRFEMPPTLPQFVQLCDQSKPRPHSPLANSSEVPKRNLAVAEKHLNEIATILKKKGVRLC